MPSEDFRRLFEALRVAVAVADAQGSVAFANAAFVELAAQDAKSLPGTDLAGLFAPEDRKRIQQNIVRVGDGKAASASLDAQLSPHGVIRRWVSVTLQPSLDASDKAAGVIMVLRDIGAQRETDDALDLVTARLLAFAEACPVAAMIETLPGDVELANEAFCELLQIDSAPQSLSGLPAQEVLRRSPVVDPAEVERAQHGTAETASVSLKLPAGRAVSLERRLILVGEEPAGAIWIARELATAPAVERGAAEIAVIEKVGQDLSAALEGLSLVAARAQQVEMDAPMLELFEQIRQSMRSAMGAVGDLVDFSKTSGTIALVQRPFRLRPALAVVIDQVASAAEESGCRLRLKVEQDVADALLGDVARLQLALKNLLCHAFTLAAGGDVLLQITPEYTTETGIQVSFSISIAAGKPAPAGRTADNGMGVALARYIVGAMGGKLAIAARPVGDVPYHFTIEFPTAEPSVAPPRASYATLVGMPVLLVTADAAQREALSKLLRGWRMVPLEADNAAMAIALLERLHREGTQIPLVILSNRLPLQDGFLLSFRIRNHPRFAATLVMMLASEGRPGDAIACRENGIAAYMRYPIADHQLNEAIVAVTGASIDADDTPTLVTRHSLREQRKGATVLLVDPSRDSQILAAHIMGRHDCSIVVANDLAEATSALDQDVYDLVLVDTSLAGLEGAGAAAALRSRITRDPEATRIVAVSLEHSPRYRERKLAEGFDGTIGKPFRKDDLVALLQSMGRASAEADKS